MNNTVKRILLFTLAVPGLGAMIWFLPWAGHAAVAAVVALVGVLGAVETRNLLGDAAPARWTAAFGALFPAAAWAAGLGLVPGSVETALVVASLLWAFSAGVFADEESRKNGLRAVGARLVQAFYPGWFLAWIVRLAFLPESRVVILVYMLAVFLNDSGAWLFGVLFGRHRGIVPVSPNKSLEGFFGGVLASVLVLAAAGWLFPGAFPLSWGVRVAFGLVAAFTTIAGDLVESALKRAAGVKDSGSIILGRGGMLDSIDSLLFTAPVFVLFLGGS